MTYKIIYSNNKNESSIKIVKRDAIIHKLRVVDLGLPK